MIYIPIQISLLKCRQFMILSELLTIYDKLSRIVSEWSENVLIWKYMEDHDFLSICTSSGWEPGWRFTARSTLRVKWWFLSRSKFSSERRQIVMFSTILEQLRNKVELSWNFKSHVKVFKLIDKYSFLDILRASRLAWSTVHLLDIQKLLGDLMAGWGRRLSVFWSFTNWKNKANVIWHCPQILLKS